MLNTQDVEMSVPHLSLILVTSPFFQAFLHSDFLGKLIFLALIAASICCWTILIHKIWLTRLVQSNSKQFHAVFQKQKGNLLHIENANNIRMKTPNPFLDLFQVLKKQTIGILKKNHRFGIQKDSVSYLSPTDVECIESHLISSIASQTKKLEKKPIYPVNHCRYSAIVGPTRNSMGDSINVLRIANACDKYNKPNGSWGNLFSVNNDSTWTYHCNPSVDSLQLFKKCNSKF